MASARVWPNYLDAAALELLRGAKLAGPPRGEVDGPPLAEVMADVRFAPPIPAGRVGEDVVVYRDQLFAKFHGLLTYGSPLDKFAAIWPPTVAINRHWQAFPPEAIWIRLFSRLLLERRLMVE